MRNALRIAEFRESIDILTRIATVVSRPQSHLLQSYSTHLLKIRVYHLLSSRLIALSSVSLASIFDRGRSINSCYCAPIYLWAHKHSYVSYTIMYVERFTLWNNLIPAVEVTITGLLVHKFERPHYMALLALPLVFVTWSRWGYPLNLSILVSGGKETN